MCTVLLPLGDYPIAVKNISYHIISYHIISYHIISYHIISYHIIISYNISYHIIIYHHITYHIIIYHIIYHITYHIISYHISYHIILSYIISIISYHIICHHICTIDFHMFSNVGFSVQVTCLLENGRFRAETCRYVNTICIIRGFSDTHFICWFDLLKVWMLPPSSGLNVLKTA